MLVVDEAAAIERFRQQYRLRRTDIGRLQILVPDLDLDVDAHAIVHMYDPDDRWLGSLRVAAS
jgi:hypothetical protein